MPDHRSSRRPRRLVGPVLACAVALVLLVAGGSVTGAYWTGSDTTSPGTLTAGSLDVVLNGDTDDQVSLSGLAVPDMLPGDSRAATISVVNASNGAGLRYSVTGRGTGALLPDLQVQLYAGSATNTGSTTTGYTGTCSGTALAGPTTLTTGSTTLLSVAASAARPVLATGSIDNLCVRVSVPVDAPQVSQGRTGTVVLDVTGRSVVR